MTLCEPCSRLAKALSSQPAIDLTEDIDYLAEDTKFVEGLYLEDPIQLLSTAKWCELCALIRDAFEESSIESGNYTPGLEAEWGEVFWVPTAGPRHLTFRAFEGNPFPDARIKNALHLHGVDINLSGRPDLDVCESIWLELRAKPGKLNVFRINYIDSIPLDSPAALSGRIFGNRQLTSSGSIEFL